MSLCGSPWWGPDLLSVHFTCSGGARPFRFDGKREKASLVGWFSHSALVRSFAQGGRSRAFPDSEIGPELRRLENLPMLDADFFFFRDGTA